jgi:ABC-type arginine transport system ATPase subunit
MESKAAVNGLGGDSERKTPYFLPLIYMNQQSTLYEVHIDSNYGDRVYIVGCALEGHGDLISVVQVTNVTTSLGWSVIEN